MNHHIHSEQQGSVVAPVKFVPFQTATTQGGAVVFFTAHQGPLREITFDPIVFNQVLVNQGSGYNNQTGIFSAPETGIYQFMFSAQLCRGGANNFWQFVVNQVPKSLCHAQVANGDTTLNTCYMVETLQQDDRVWVKQRESSCAWASAVSKTITFSGVLLTSRRGMYSSSCALLGRDMYGTSVQSSVATLHLTAVPLMLCLLLCLCIWLC
ncbi:hypothetical protein WMY93_002646 [Mugilogobius chulae]|uniref:C1q domain-containing protein n=1 Tax=Mugilogobius chulae TaxID=88201 RepID=A0AAW0Q2R0_9GOBI